MSDRGNACVLSYVCFFVGSVLSILVIAAVFWWVSMLTEALIMQNARATGRRLVDTYMLEVHFKKWEEFPELEKLVTELVEDLQLKDYKAGVLALEEIGRPGVRLPVDKQEEELVTRLEEILHDQRFQARSAAKRQGKPQNGVALEKSLIAGVQSGEAPPVFVDRIVPGGSWKASRYEYYQPVYWKPNCSKCHESFVPANTAVANSTLDGISWFCVVKISMDGAEIERVRSGMRAKIITAAIATMVLPLIGMFIAVKMMVATGRESAPPDRGGDGSDRAADTP